jgi:lysozyme
MLRKLLDKVTGGDYVFNEAGLALIKEYEGLRLKAYLCSAGVPTIGYGTTIYPTGRAVELGDTCTAEEAEAYLRVDIARKEAALKRFLKAHAIPLTSNQYSALVSFAYNLGTGMVTGAERSIGKALRAKDFNKAAACFGLYNRAGGKVLLGLVRRRAAERALFLKP